MNVKYAVLDNKKVREKSASMRVLLRCYPGKRVTDPSSRVRIGSQGSYKKLKLSNASFTCASFRSDSRLCWHQLHSSTGYYNRQNPQMFNFRQLGLGRIKTKFSNVRLILQQFSRSTESFSCHFQHSACLLGIV